MGITVTFKNGTNIDIAQVDVQNRIQSVLPQLPQTVRDLGITVRKGSTDILLIVHMFATDASVDRKYIANYANLQVRERLLRTQGVGDVNINAARDYAMRVWIDPDRAAARDLTVDEIVAALRNNNLQVAGGAVGSPPFNDNPAAYQLSIRAQGRLDTPEEFADAIIKRDAQGRVTRIGDVARVELGAQNYAVNAYKSLEPAVSLSVQQAPDTNALETWDNIRDTMEELKRQFPPGVAYEIIFNPVAFTRAAVDAVQETLLEAMILAVIVVVLFLQRWRTAIIPLLAIPISLIGTLAVMSVFGFSLNNLSMFGLVLSIGIVVDDAIVVVENAERHLRAGMAPREAAHLTMDEVGGALIGIALVLVAVFVPTAFIGGIAGQFYKQFALTIASATAISLLVSLTLSPALAAVILKPHDATHARSKLGARLHAFGERANGWLERLSARLRAFHRRSAAARRAADRALRGPARAHRLARARHAARLHPRAGPERRRDLAHDAARHEPRAHGRGRAAGDSDRARHAGRVVRVRVRRHGRHHASATRRTPGQIWAIFDPFEERLPKGLTVDVIAAELRKRLAGITAAEIRIVNPASVRGMGNNGGFQMMVEDRGGLGYRALEEAVQQLTEAATADPAISLAFSNFNTRNPTLDAVVDRDKAEMLGVPVRNVFAHAPDLSRRHLRQQHQPARPHVPGDRAGRRGLSPGRGVGRAAQDALGVRGDGAAQRDRHAAARDRAVSRAALQPLSGRRHPGRHRAGLFVRPSDRRDGAPRARHAAHGHGLRVDRPRVPAADVGRLRRARVRARRGVRVHLPGRALREPDAAARRDPDRADVPARRDPRRELCAASTTTSSRRSAWWC